MKPEDRLVMLGINPSNPTPSGRAHTRWERSAIDFPEEGERLVVKDLIYHVYTFGTLEACLKNARLKMDSFVVAEGEGHVVIIATKM